MTTETDIQPSFDAALALHRTGQTGQAEQAYRAVLARQPDHADALNNLALLLKQRGAFDEAEEAYHESLVHKPQVPEVLSNLGVLMLEQGRLKEAETALREALKQRPDYLEAWNNFGNLMQAMRQHDEAVDAYRRIIDAAPRRLNALGERIKSLLAEPASVPDAKAETARLQGVGRTTRATLLEAYWNLSLLLLLKGDYVNAWPLHESRYDPGRVRPVLLPPKLPMPMWRGEALAGKAILVWFEQGFFLFRSTRSRWLRWRKLGRNRFDLVAAHVFVHVAPAVVDACLGQPAINRVTIFNCPAGVATCAADSFTLCIQPRFLDGGIFQAQFSCDLVTTGRQSHAGNEGQSEFVHVANSRIFEKNVQECNLCGQVIIRAPNF